MQILGNLFLNIFASFFVGFLKLHCFGICFLFVRTIIAATTGREPGDRGSMPSQGDISDPGFAFIYLFTLR